MSAEDVVKRLRDFADNPASNGFVPLSPTTIREAAALIESLEKDARRYRWWRDRYRSQFVICLPGRFLKIDVYKNGDFGPNKGELVDAAIDAAIAAKDGA